MVQYFRHLQDGQLDLAFAAIADSTRRAILERLRRGSATVSELAQPFDMMLTGLNKHVGCA